LDGVCLQGVLEVIGVWDKRRVFNGAELRDVIEMEEGFRRNWKEAERRRNRLI